MRGTRRTIWVAGLLSFSLAASAVRAQSGPAAAIPDSANPSPDSAGGETKKKGGLFGKAKKFVGDKTVQTVAKTVACTMVPGGQYVAGAIDAAGSEDAGDAAAGAAGAATGQTCMPGMGGMGAGGMGATGAASEMMPGVGGAAGLAGMAGAGGLMPSGMPGGMPSGAMPGGMNSSAMGNSDVLAGCMGLTPEEYREFSDPTRGEARQPTKAEVKRQQELSKKVDMRRSQACLMQQAMAGPAGAMARAGEPSADEAVAGGDLSEAPGRSVTLGADPAAELAKGRTVVKDIDWLAGGGDVSQEGAASFAKAMATLASAIAKAGGSYRADIYLDQRYDDVAVAPIGAARLETLQAALQKAGLEAGVVTPGTTKKDKKPRLEIVKAKK